MQYIIMQDKHPIDELFRQGLEGASVTPPPSVWAGLQRSRGRGGWRRKALAGILLLGLGAATWSIVRQWGPGNIEADGLVGHAFVDHQGSSATDQQGRPGRNPVASIDTGPTPAIASVEKRSEKGLTEHGMTTVEGPTEAGRTEKSNALEVPASGSHRSMERMVPSGAGDEVQPAPQVERPADGDGNGPTDKETLQRLFLLPVGTGLGPATPQDARPEPFVLRPADLWVSAEVGLFRWDQRHVGDDAALAADRDRSLSPGREMGAGILVGRTWRNGLRLGIGVSRHVGEHAFVHDTRKDSIAWDVLENVVVLDTLVIAQATDSVGTIYARASRTTGTTRLESWVVPVEVGWGLRKGRWSLELLAGLAWERRRWAGGPMMVRTAEGGVSGTSYANETTLRYDVFGLRAGLMAGFWPAERLLISAGPWHDRGVVSTSDEGSLHRRTGGRLRLTYLLERPGR